MDNYTFKLYTNNIPNPDKIKNNHLYIIFKYCNISELAYVDEEFINHKFILPNYVEFFDISYNSIYAFFEGVAHDYKLPVNLKVFNCSFNKLIGLPDIIPNDLFALNASNNSIKYIPKLPAKIKILNCSNNCIKWFDQELPNIEKINISYNRLTYFRFDRMYENIQIIDLSSNLLETIYGEFPKNLKILNLEDNRIKEVPSLPETLIELNLAKNKLEEIKEYPKTIEKLNISDNNIKYLSKSILECNNLQSLNYENNDNIEIDLEILKYIDKKFDDLSKKIDLKINKEKVKDYYNTEYNNIETIYDNPQNAHNIKIKEKILDSISNILNDEKPDISFEETLEKLNDLMKEDIKDIINSIKDEFIDENKDISIPKLLPYLYNRIKSLNFEESLIKEFENTIINTKMVCFSGKIEGYISVFCGFFEDININIDINEQLLSKLQLIKKKLYNDRIPIDSLDYCVRLKYYFEKELNELKLDNEISYIWIEPLDFGIKNKENEILDDIKNKIDDKKKFLLNLIKNKKIKEYYSNLLNNEINYI